jgi:uncharacterized protein (DUF58 family)
VTRRGRSVLALGFLVYAAAWAFGSKPLYPVATGFIVVSVLAWLWMRLANGPFRMHRRGRESDVIEGEDVPLRVELESVRTVWPASVELVEQIGRLGEQRHVLRRFGRSLRIDYVLPRVPRGRYAFEAVRAELSDPFGLQRVVVPLPAPAALLVYPRLVRLERLFSDGGAGMRDGRPVLLNRRAGFELHSVREYVQGESLRNVHWRSTARRGELMVKELEDTPRDEVAVLLDADARAIVGDSFNTQVRAAGSILDAHARRGRRAVLLVNGREQLVQHVRSPAADWRRALELLAAVEPNGRAPLASLLAEEASAAARALELTVVTARLDGKVADRLVERALSRRRVSVVYVDCATFAGTASRPEPLLLRLQAARIPIAVVRAGDDLRACLAEQSVREAARA